MSEKQDAVYTRTAAALEQKLNYNKRFAEVMGVATDARDKANEASEAADNLDKNLTSKNIFDRLTENGTLQGLYRDNDGNLYINAEYIQAVDKLFANTLTVSGKFIQRAEIFLEPEQEELETIKKHLLGTKIIPVNDIPLYDFNNDGQVTLADLAVVELCMLGKMSISSWSGAVKSNVTMSINLSNPDRLIWVTGTNMWGRSISKYVGVNSTNIQNLDVENRLQDYIVESGSYGSWDYRKWNSGIAECWCTVEYNTTVTGEYGNIYTSAPSPFAAIDYPFEFTSAPTEQCTCNHTSAGAMNYGGNTYAKSGKYIVWRGTKSDTETTYRLSLSVVGRWK